MKKSEQRNEAFVALTKGGMGKTTKGKDKNKTTCCFFALPVAVNRHITTTQKTEGIPFVLDDDSLKEF